LNTAYQQASEFEGPMTLSGKFVFFYERVLDQPGSLVLIVLLGLFALLTIFQKSSLRKGFLIHLIFLVLLPVSLLVGSFLPTPVWYQYFYAPLPFIILGILYSLAELNNHGLPLRLVSLGLFTLTVLWINVAHADQYPNLRTLTRPGSWYPIQTRVLGYKINTIAADRRVLTLSPLFVLDGGGRIYPQLATGPFAWRVADLLTEEERHFYQVMSKNDLAEALKKQPTGGILVGLTKDAEDPLLEFAQIMRYNPFQISDHLVLWAP
jgi:hypothetical protein